MPGLCGFIIPTRLVMRNPETVLYRMQDMLVYRPHHIRAEISIDATIASTGVHLQQILPTQIPYSCDDIDVRIDGEFYLQNLPPSPCFTALLANHYRLGTLLSFLNKTDGIFTAVIYDRKKRLLHIISDRYGLKHLYLTQQNDIIAWSSEIKALRCIAALRLDVSDQAINEFLTQGYFSGNRTWFDRVHLIAPGTIQTFNLDQHTGTRHTYWSFDSINVMEHVKDSTALAMHLGELFIAAVKKRCGYNERVGIGLSGGLDSRALFAAIPEYCNPLYAVTFGRNNCPDIRIAAQVTKLRTSRHIIQTIDESNWLNNRFTGVWLSDGQISLQHMHGIEKIDDFKNYYDIELNGFLGDALLGGSYSNAAGGEINCFYNRGRRFIATALSLGNLSYYTRLPFFDNDLMELTLSIPVTLRKNSRIYNQMLLHLFPNYFASIPWQKTNLPISKTGLFWDTVRIARKGLFKMMDRIPVMPRNNDYVAYASWIRREPAVNQFKAFLTASDTILHQYIEKKTIIRDLDHHFSGGDKTEILCRYLTIEIWMRQFFRNELLSGPPD